MLLPLLSLPRMPAGARLAPTLSTLCLAAALTLPATAAHGAASVYFAAKDDLESMAASEIARTSHHVDALLPSLADAPLRRALEKAAEAGKQVRVIVGAKPGTACKPCAALESAGADVRLLDPRVADRIVLIDGPRGRHDKGMGARLLLPSGALGKPTADQSLVTLTREGDLALSYQREFDELWAKARDYKDRAALAQVEPLRPSTAARVSFSSANMVALDLGDEGWKFTPAHDKQQGELTRSLATAINQAYRTVELSAPSLRSPELFRALTAAVDRGVDVRVLVGDNQYGGLVPRKACVVAAKVDAKRFDECLGLAGAIVRYHGAGRLEGGYAVIDGQLALRGTYGGTAKSERTSFSHLLSLRGEAALTLRQHFDAMFDRGASPFQKPGSGSTQAAGKSKSKSKNKKCGDTKPVSYSMDAMAQFRQAALVRCR
jgi:hypothetical protein